MNVQKKSNKPNRGLLLLGRAALTSAYAGANSACAFIFHDPAKPEALRKLKKRNL